MTTYLITLSALISYTFIKIVVGAIVKSFIKTYREMKKNGEL